MKRIFTALFCAAASIASAADLFVQEFGGGGTYPNISDAITAASAGDRILVVPKAGNAPYIESFTINKELQLLTAANGAVFYLQGSITIAGTLPANAHIVIDGLRITNGNIIAGNSTNDIAVSIVNCTLQSGYISLGTKIYATVANNSVTTGANAIRFTKGKILGNTIEVNNIGITASNGIASLDTTHIAGNRITLNNSSVNAALRGIQWDNNTQFFNISNNYFYSTAIAVTGSSGFDHSLIYISAYKAGANTNQFNSIVNNTLRFAIPTSWSSSYDFIGINSAVSLNNRCNILNNLILFPASSQVISRRAFAISGSPQISYNILSGATTLNSGSATVDASNTAVPATAYTVNANGCTTTAVQRNNGHPDPIFTDLDLTRNDVGACGGSYNITNFVTAGTAGSAKVHWLEAPRRVLQGGTLNINAEGHDR